MRGMSYLPRRHCRAAGCCFEVDRGKLTSTELREGGRADVTGRLLRHEAACWEGPLLAASALSLCIRVHTILRHPDTTHNSLNQCTCDRPSDQYLYACSRLMNPELASRVIPTASRFMSMLTMLTGTWYQVCTRTYLLLPRRTGCARAVRHVSEP